MAKSDLNMNERRLHGVVLEHAAQEMTIAAMAKMAFPKQPKARGQSWVRNSLRKLVRLGHVRQVGRGVYQAGRTVRDYPSGSAATRVVFDQAAPRSAPNLAAEPKPGSLAARILELLRGRELLRSRGQEYQMTDERMATALDAPKPSVRRARASLGARVRVGVLASDRTKTWVIAEGT